MNEEKMRALFLLSGFEISSVYELANEYWPVCEEYSDIRRKSPWWLVNTEFGLIKLGWRKRVIEIDWKDTPYRSGISKFNDDRDKFIPVLTKDEVTKTETYVHAWSYGKAVDYLSTLHLRLRQVAYVPDNEKKPVKINTK